MPLSKLERKELQATCRKIRNKPYKFFYCLEADSGEPALLIGRRITAEARALRKSAKKKKFVEGEVFRCDSGLEFRTKTPDAAKFARNLKRFFGQSVPALKSASVVPYPEAEGEAAVEPAGDNARDRYQALRERLDSARQAIAARERTLRSAIRRGNLSVARSEMQQLSRILNNSAIGA